jgi:voltage-gated potassium channel
MDDELRKAGTSPVLSDTRHLAMTKPLVLHALAKFVAATAGRNMTKPAYAAVAIGVGAMVLLTVDPAYESAHHWVDGVLWGCLAFFAFESLVRIRHAVRSGRGFAYLVSARGLIDTASAVAVPAAMLFGAPQRTAWLLAVVWLVKVIPGVPGLRQLRRVLVLESGPLLSVLVIFLTVLFLGSIAEYLLERDAQPATFGNVPAALWWAVVTLTTTGYGDVVPITPLGRIVAEIGRAHV